MKLSVLSLIFVLFINESIATSKFVLDYTKPPSNDTNASPKMIEDHGITPEDAIEITVWSLVAILCLIVIMLMRSRMRSLD